MNNPTQLDAEIIKHIIHRNSDLKNEIVVIKLDAKIIEQDGLLMNFVENIKVISDSGAKIIIIHDYTNLVSSTLKLFNIDQKIIQDWQVADHKTTQIIEMVLSGYINKRIVSSLAQAGCKSVGISGKDGYLIESRKSFIARKHSDELIDIGFLGEPIEVNCDILNNFIDSDIVTVISPVSFGLNGATYILDADITAAVIACEIMSKHLIFLTSLGSISVNGQELRTCSLNKLRQLLQQNLIQAGYEKIINAARRALENNTKFVYIGNATTYDTTLLTIFASHFSTKIVL